MTRDRIVNARTKRTAKRSSRSIGVSPSQRIVAGHHHSGSVRRSWNLRNDGQPGTGVSLKVYE
jgi:hypothetical protein